VKRRKFVQSLAGVTTVSGIGAGLGVSTAAAMTDDVDVTAEITAVLRKTEQLWAAQDTVAMRDLWDTDNENPIYLAGEQEDFFVGWDAINQYLAPKNAPKITVRKVAADIAFAAYWMRTDMKLVFQPKPFGSDNRATALFRRTAAGWKYLTYVEAFQSPSMYFQKLYEKDVSADYPEFFESVTGKKLD
jgi:hypothetical protein